MTSHILFRTWVALYQKNMKQASELLEEFSAQNPGNKERAEPFKSTLDPKKPDIVIDWRLFFELYVSEVGSMQRIEITPLMMYSIKSAIGMLQSSLSELDEYRAFILGMLPNFTRPTANKEFVPVLVRMMDSDSSVAVKALQELFGIYESRAPPDDSTRLWWIMGLVNIVVVAVLVFILYRTISPETALNNTRRLEDILSIREKKALTNII